MIKSIIIKIAKKLKLIDDISIYRRRGVSIGKNCRFYNVSIDGGHGYLVEVGDNCILTNCTILSHDGSTKNYIGKSRIGKVIIGDRCFIGLQSIILPNVVIGDDCIIGAGAVVTRSIPSNSVVGGNPAKVIMSTEDFKKKHEEYMKSKPVFEIYWKHKSNEQKMQEKELLKDTFGYDE